MEESLNLSIIPSLKHTFLTLKDYSCLKTLKDFYPPIQQICLANVQKQHSIYRRKVYIIFKRNMQPIIEINIFV